MPNIVGTSGDDYLAGTADSDTILGKGGNDELDGQDGNDTLRGGAGNDVLYGGAGLDEQFGDEGDDNFGILDPTHLVAGELYSGGSGTDWFKLQFSGDPPLLVDISAVTLTSIEGLEAYAGLSVRLTAAQLDALSFMSDTVFHLSTGGTVQMNGADVSREFHLADAATVFDLTGAFRSLSPVGAYEITVYGGSAQDQITGSAAANALYGAGGNDTLAGGDGNDLLVGGDGFDTLNGGAGDDTLLISALSELVAGETYDGGAGEDILLIEITDDPEPIADLSAINLSGTEGVEMGGNVIVRLTAAQLDAITYIGNGNSELTTGGTISMAGTRIGAGAITLADFATAIDFTGAIPTGGAQRIVVYGGASGDTITGSAFNDALLGRAGDDIIAGADGDDFIVGDAGLDHLSGGNGDDTFFYGSAAEIASGETIDGGAGSDWLQITLSDGDADFSLLAVTGVERIYVVSGEYLLNISVQDLKSFDEIGGLFRVFGSGTVDLAGKVISSGIFALSDAITSFDLTGAISSDATISVFGDVGDNTIRSGSGEDYVYGGHGVDTVYGGAARDWIYGNGGADLLFGEGTKDLIFGGDGDDLLDGGDGDDQLYGDQDPGLIGIIGPPQTGNDTLIGGNGDDELDGGFGADTMIGGPGNDTYYLDNVGDSVSEGLNEGTDKVFTGLASYTLGANVEDLTYTGTANSVLIGNDLENTIWGDVGNDLIDGGNGKSYLVGGAGDDRLVLGSGANGSSIFGVSGFDTLVVNASTLLTYIEGIEAIELVGGANLTFDGYHFRAEGISPTTAISGSGTITVNMWPGYAVDAAGFTAASGGSLTFVVNGSLHHDTVTGIDGITNLLNGGAGVDTLRGGTGDDTLDGGSGTNALFGGAGSDRLLVDASGSGTSIDGGLGTDTLTVSGAVSLGSITGIEAVELTAGSNLILTASQAMTGLAFNNAFSGSGTVTINMGGAVLLGIAGFQGAASNPGITFTINGTVDSDYIKGSQFANTILGGAGQDQLRGGNGVDTIDGGTERDKIAGWGGADVLTGGDGGDQFRYLFATDSGIGAAADRITDFTIGSDVIDFRLLDSDVATPDIQNYAFSFIGTAAFAVGGGAQVRYANSGADLLVQMDLDGNGAADMEIVLQGLAGQTMSAGDFLFVL